MLLKMTATFRLFFLIGRVGKNYLSNFAVANAFLSLFINMIRKLTICLLFAFVSVFAASAQSVERVPYKTSFDNTYGEYDGTSYIPNGWLMTGDNPFFTASMNELEAYDGTYYLVSQNNTVSPRNEHLYTPLFHMEKGRTYEVSYQLYMPGLYYAYLDDNHRYAEASHHPTHTLTVGEEQDYDFHTLHAPLLTVADSLSPEWHLQRAAFTPDETGDYCFCLAFTSQETYHGDVAIDDFMVTYDGAVLKPTVDFSHGGMFDLMYSCVMDFAGGGVPFTSIMQYTTGCEWTVTDADTGQLITTSTAENPRFYFPETGNYRVSLRGYNSEYDVTCTKNITVEKVGTAGYGFAPIYTYGETISSIYKPNYTPVIGLDDPQDFATGPNHTYRRFAERIEMPDNVTLTLNTLQYFLSQCSFASLQSGSVRTIPFTFALYGETDGLPDESKKIWSKTVTMGDAFSTNTGGLGGATQLSLAMGGVKATGTFYVAFEFDDTFPVDSWNASGDRSVIEMTSCQHFDNVSRLYYKDQKTQLWHPMDYFHPGLGGLGLSLVLWTAAEVSEPVGISSPVLPASPSATYDMQGRRTNATQHGVYIVDGKKVMK